MQKNHTNIMPTIKSIKGIPALKTARDFYAEMSGEQQNNLRRLFPFGYDQAEKESETKRAKRIVLEKLSIIRVIALFNNPTLEDQKNILIHAIPALLNTDGSDTERLKLLLQAKYFPLCLLAVAHPEEFLAMYNQELKLVEKEQEKNRTTQGNKRLQIDLGK